MLTEKNIRRVVCGALQENAYLVCPEGQSTAFFVDPGDDAEALLKALEKSGRTLEAVVLTHGHFDHILGAQPLAEATGCKVFVSREDSAMLEDAELSEYMPQYCVLTPPTDLAPTAYGETLTVCGETLHVLKTPGHTKGSVCLYETEGKILFSGDTLFYRGFGRTDLRGGSDEEMRRSIRQLFAMDADVLVLPGHGCETTIGAERRQYGL